MDDIHPEMGKTTLFRIKVTRSFHVLFSHVLKTGVQEIPHLSGGVPRIPFWSQTTGLPKDAQKVCSCPVRDVT